MIALLASLPLTACGRESIERSIGRSSTDIVVHYTSADYIAHLNVDELAHRATDIVRVEVLDSRVEMINTMLPPFDEGEDISAGYEIHTVNRLRVLEVFKGNAEPETVMEVMQLGGQLNNEYLINNSLIQFSYGDDLILFMRTFDVEGLPSILLTPNEAVYRTIPTNQLTQNAMAANAVTAIESAGSIAEAFHENQWLENEVLESYSPWNPLQLTIGDLMRFSGGGSASTRD